MRPTRSRSRASRCAAGLDRRHADHRQPRTATAVLAQFKQAAGSDGHFVVFDIPTAREADRASFLGTLAATGQATVVVAVS